MNIEVTVDIGVIEDYPDIIFSAYYKVIKAVQDDMCNKAISNRPEFHDTMGILTRMCGDLNWIKYL